MSQIDRSETPPTVNSKLRAPLVVILVFGVVIVLAMLGTAFGPAGLAFGLTLGACACAFIKSRYRFSLRTYLIVTMSQLPQLTILYIRNPEITDEAATRFRTANPNCKFSHK